MKSIKEKAEEVFKIEEYDSLETAFQTRKMRLCYEHGANYVLEQIEEFQKLFSTCMNAHANGYLKSVIEQLKK